MEARLARVESAIEQIRTDIAGIRSDIRGVRNHARAHFRILLGALIASLLCLAAIVARGFLWI